MSSNTVAISLGQPIIVGLAPISALLCFGFRAPGRAEHAEPARDNLTLLEANIRDLQRLP